MITYPPIELLPAAADVDAVCRCVGSGQLNDGRITRQLEDAIGKYHDCECVCVSSGTSALEIILRYIGHGSYTIPFCSHISTVAAAINAGASRFECVTEPFISADLNGRLANCGEIADACQSALTIGIMEGRKAVALSFGPIKTITGAGGGAILSRDPDLILYAREYKSYGRRIGGDDSNTLRIGSNHKMSDVNAALALSQWNRREEIIEDKWRIHNAYAALLKDRIWPRKKNEVPWLIECTVSPIFAAYNTFRAYHPQYGHYPVLRDYITNWSAAQAPTSAVYLPSQFGLPQKDIEKYAHIIVEKDK